MARPFTDSPVNHVDVAVLVAGRHELDQYDIVKGCKDTRIASMVTVSNTKPGLVTEACLETPSVQQWHGRPRDHLHLAGPVSDMSDTTAIVATVARLRQS